MPAPSAKVAMVATMMPAFKVPDATAARYIPAATRLIRLLTKNILAVSNFVTSRCTMTDPTDTQAMIIAR